jgi:hypothetical protein
VALVIGLLLVSGVFLVDANQTETFGGAEESSQLNGVMSAWSKLVDGIGNIVWSSADPESGVLESVIDPVSGKEVAHFYMGARYEATGANIDWSTMHVDGVWEAVLYRSPNAEYRWNNEWSSMELHGEQSGDLQSTAIEVDPLVPEKVTMIWRIYNPDTGMKEVITKTYYQRTKESHPIHLEFEGRYYVTVYDIYGHKYEDFLRQTVALDLQWVGSDFEIQWSDISGEGLSGVTSAPTMSHLADFATPQGSTTTLVWATDDMDKDIMSYTVSLDGAVIASNGFAGGQLSYTMTWPDSGTFDLKMAVTDMAGNTVEDNIVVDVYIEGDGEVISPSADTSGTQNFDGGDAGIPAQSIFGGTGNTQVLVYLAIAGGVAWLLYNRRKKR